MNFDYKDNEIIIVRNSAVTVPVRAAPAPLPLRLR
jgi:hypothetical protein